MELKLFSNRFTITLLVLALLVFVSQGTELCTNFFTVNLISMLGFPSILMCSSLCLIQLTLHFCCGRCFLSFDNFINGFYLFHVFCLAYSVNGIGSQSYVNLTFLYILRLFNRVFQKLACDIVQSMARRFR